MHQIKSESCIYILVLLVVGVNLQAVGQEKIVRIVLEAEKGIFNMLKY